MDKHQKTTPVSANASPAIAETITTTEQTPARGETNSDMMGNS